ncbi:hypothetical protein CAEBREN_04659 [Caenorhabditis brenneri]|uniref:Uncharacterized protein n=1 Tax=Caenorhabditis brenneri TaxID=135651 RepID=G0MDE4_CAEBE|nr:hypothetical protein CAEBREN_04659 [Caenorhabditis brenneri]
MFIFKAHRVSCDQQTTRTSGIMDNQSAANNASDVAPRELPANSGVAVPPVINQLSPADWARIATTEGLPLARMDPSQFERAISFQSTNAFLTGMVPMLMKFEQNEGRIIAFQVLCNQKDAKIEEIEKEMEEQKSRFGAEKEAEKKAWLEEKRELERKLVEANNRIDSLEKRSKNESMQHEKEKEEMKNIHKTELEELSTKITELSENVHNLGKIIKTKDTEINVLKADAKMMDEVEKILKRRRGEGVTSEETAVTPKKEIVHNNLETHNKENTGERPELVTVEEMNEKPIRKRKGEKTRSGDKKQPKL